MNAPVQLRIPRHLWGPLWEGVKRSGTQEPVVFGFVSQAQVSGRTLILVRNLVFPPPAAFVSAANHGAKWSGAYNIALLNEALAHGLGIMIFHYHPGAARVRLSQDDERSARQLLPAFQMVVPGRPHGTVVLGETSIAGLILPPGTSIFVNHLELRFFSETITTLPRQQRVDLVVHYRQPLVNGTISTSLLRSMSVAVVGLSGGGSQVATQLAGLGVGEIIGIDRQRITRDNMLATDEFGWVDVLLRRRKTAAVKSKVHWINRNVRFTSVDSLVPEKEAIESLKRADIIVGCVNSLNARADLQEIAWRYCIPYVDIGLGLYPLDPKIELSEIASINGNVSAAVPGGPCLWCSGFLTEKKLELEAGGNRSYLRSVVNKGEERGSGAYVASFNAVLAGLAASDVLQLILGYTPTLSVRKQYDGLSGTVLEMVVVKNPDCPKCSSFLAAGDPLWE